MTSVSQAAIRAEHKLIVQEAFNSMDALDREVLVLRHFEHLNNEETAQAWVSRNRRRANGTSGR